MRPTDLVMNPEWQFVSDDELVETYVLPVVELASGSLCLAADRNWVLAVLVVIAPAATAQQRPGAPAAPAAADPAKKPTPKLPDGHPDLNGYWAISRGPDTPVNSDFGQRNPFIKRGDWRNAKEAYASASPAACRASGRRSRRDHRFHHRDVGRTDIHLRRHRAKKRDKLRARIAAAPPTERPALEAKVQRTYAPSHSMMKEKLPPAVV
jgi:hypothetical protein